VDRLARQQRDQDATRSRPVLCGQRHVRPRLDAPSDPGAPSLWKRLSPPLDIVTTPCHRRERERIMPLPSHFRTFGVDHVTIIRNLGTEDETRVEAEAHVQAESGFFAVDTPIYEGDVVDIRDPRGGMDRRLAAEVHVNNPSGAAFRGMEHIEVKWGKAPAVRVAPVRRLTIDNLHPQVIAVAGDLFADGHFDSAVSEAFKSLDIRVRDLIGSTQSGTKLMGEAFGGQNPRLDVSESEGQSGRDEQEGFGALFRGAMLGVRNPKAHEPFKAVDPQRALEYLGFASLLHRRLDNARASAEEPRD
jgi:uncharacterized protein (TIGR02391 family)